MNGNKLGVLFLYVSIVALIKEAGPGCLAAFVCYSIAGNSEWAITHYWSHVRIDSEENSP